MTLPLFTPLLRWLTQWIQHQYKQQMQDRLNMIHHELRGPITALTGYAELAHQELETLRDTPTQDQVLRQRLKRLSTLLEHVCKQQEEVTLLAEELTRALDTDLFPVTCEQVDLVALVHRSLSRHRVLHPRRLQFEMQMQPIWIWADPLRTTQVLENYVTNALAYAPVEAPIFIEIEPRGLGVRVSVQDQGPGLAPATQQHIWKRGYRTRLAREQRPGSGLGLAIVRQLITRQHGMAGVESVPGQGSTFWFELPLIADPS